MTIDLLRNGRFYVNGDRAAFEEAQDLIALLEASRPSRVVLVTQVGASEFHVYWAAEILDLHQERLKYEFVAQER